jgi:hypothetical protein
MRLFTEAQLSGDDSPRIVQSTWGQNFHGHLLLAGTGYSSGGEWDIRQLKPVGLETASAKQCEICSEAPKDDAFLLLLHVFVDSERLLQHRGCDVNSVQITLLWCHFSDIWVQAGSACRSMCDYAGSHTHGFSCNAWCCDL